MRLQVPGQLVQGALDLGLVGDAALLALLDPVQEGVAKACR